MNATSLLTNAPNFEAIRSAHKRISPHIHRTPVITSASLDEIAGARLFFKCENLQKTGSFKIRGATNAIFSLTDEEARHGVVAPSSGNHAAAMSLAVRMARAGCERQTARRAREPSPTGVTARRSCVF